MLNICLDIINFQFNLFSLLIVLSCDHRFFLLLQTDQLLAMYFNDLNNLFNLLSTLKIIVLAKLFLKLLKQLQFIIDILLHC